MSEFKSIWESVSCKKEDIKNALEILLGLEFTGAFLGLRFVNFFKICEDLGIEVNKASRDQNEALKACASTLTSGKVAFTSAITETFSAFNVKLFGNGGISITDKHPSYQGGFFEWSQFHVYLELDDKSYCKVGHLAFDGTQKPKWKEFALNKSKDGPSSKAKPKKGLPGAEKDPSRYVKVEDQGFTFFVDTYWSKGKAFLDRAAYMALVKQHTKVKNNPLSLSVDTQENDE